MDTAPTPGAGQTRVNDDHHPERMRNRNDEDEPEKI
jgi:hypothetical protein